MEFVFTLPIIAYLLKLKALKTVISSSFSLNRLLSVYYTLPFDIFKKISSFYVAIQRRLVLVSKEISLA
jgi:hypothetical protein